MCRNPYREIPFIPLLVSPMEILYGSEYNTPSYEGMEAALCSRLPGGEWRSLGGDSASPVQSPDDRSRGPHLDCSIVTVPEPEPFGYAARRLLTFTNGMR